MRKSVLAIATIAALAVTSVSCKKESTTLTFSARTETSADKTILNSDHYLEWESTDKVEIFNTNTHATFNVTPCTNNATDNSWADLTGENIGDAPYTAIYPASITTSTTNDIVLPAKQVSADGSLRNFPMMATLNSITPGHQNTFNFSNLCAAIRIRLPQDSPKLKRIDMETDLSISGPCTIGTYSDGKPYAVANGGSHFVSLEISQPQNNTNNEYLITLPAGEYHSFTIRMYSANDDKIFNKSISQTITLTRNYITTFEFSQNPPTFNDPAIARLKTNAFGVYDGITSIVFHYNSSITTDINLKNPDVESENIWGYRDGNVFNVYTPADYILAPVDGSNLFSIFSSDDSRRYKLENIDFGHYFRTDETTNMNSMFYANSNLTSLDLTTFNTSNVTDMGKMFEGCGNLQQLDLSSFSSQSVQKMYKMFYYCRQMTSIEFNSQFTAPDPVDGTTEELDIHRSCSLLGYYVNGGCTIHCNSTTSGRLQEQGGIVNNSVHFIIL